MIPLDATGFIEGDFFAPVNVADAQLRLVTEGGNGVNSAILGHLTAMVYLRGDPTARCPDTPAAEGTSCILPIGALAEQSFSAFATYQEWEDWIYAQPFTVPMVMGYGGTDTVPYSDIDPTVTIDGTQSLKTTPFWGDYFESYLAPVNPVQQTDVTMLMRFRLDAFEHSGSGARDGFMIVAPFTANPTNQYINVMVRNTNRLTVNWRATTGPTTYADVDIGPASDIFDQDVELIARMWNVDTNFYGFRLYINAPCATPVLYYENLIVPKLTAGTREILDFEWMWNVSSGLDGPGDYTDTRALWIHQIAFYEDPTLAGIPA